MGDVQLPDGNFMMIVQELNNHIGGGENMIQSIVHIALVVKDYDEAIAFYTEKLNFLMKRTK